MSWFFPFPDIPPYYFKVLHVRGAQTTEETSTRISAWCLCIVCLYINIRMKKMSECTHVRGTSLGGRAPTLALVLAYMRACAHVNINICKYI